MGETSKLSTTLDSSEDAVIRNHLDIFKIDP